MPTITRCKRPVLSVKFLTVSLSSTLQQQQYNYFFFILIRHKPSSVFIVAETSSLFVVDFDRFKKTFFVIFPIIFRFSAIYATLHQSASVGLLIRSINRVWGGRLLLPLPSASFRLNNFLLHDRIIHEFDAIMLKRRVVVRLHGPLDIRSL